MTSPTERRELFRLAWPASLAMVVHSLYRLNDQYFVQDIGVEAQSAVAVGGMVAIWFMAFSQLVSTGTLAITARRLGEGDAEGGAQTIRAGLRTAVVVGFTVSVIAITGLPWLVDFLIQGENVELERQLAYDYMIWLAGGQVVLCVLPTIDSAFFAMKNTRTPMVLQVLSITTNALLNAILVPAYGVTGAGIATVISRSLSLIVGLLLLRRAGISGLRTGPAPRHVSRRILAIGLPACIGISIYSIVYQIILALTFSQFGAGGRSALGIGFGIESIFWCFFWGVGTAVASLVGRSLGEGQPDKAVAIARTAARASLVLGIGTSIAFWALGPTLVGIFADSELAQDANVEYLRILAWAQPFQALQVIYEQTLIGAGATLPVMISTGVMNIARIPLAHLLAVVLGWGLPGIWWAVNLSSFGKYLWSVVLFKRGRWQDREV